MDGGTPADEPVSAGELTILLERARAGDNRAEEQIYELVYAELRRLAARHLRRQPIGNTLQPSDIVHEAYLRLVGAGSDRLPKNRIHFFALASRAMRQILVDHARGKKTVKHGGEMARVSLDDCMGVAANPGRGGLNVLDLDRALVQLSKLHERQGRVAEMRFFAGFTIAETAEALDVSVGTVEGDSMVARTWLRRALGNP